MSLTCSITSVTGFPTETIRSDSANTIFDNLIFKIKNTSSSYTCRYLSLGFCINDGDYTMLMGSSFSGGTGNGTFIHNAVGGFDEKETLTVYYNNGSTGSLKYKISDSNYLIAKAVKNYLLKNTISNLVITFKIAVWHTTSNSSPTDVETKSISLSYVQYLKIGVNYEIERNPSSIVYDINFTNSNGSVQLSSEYTTGFTLGIYANNSYWDYDVINTKRNFVITTDSSTKEKIITDKLNITLKNNKIEVILKNTAGTYSLLSNATIPDNNTITAMENYTIILDVYQNEPDIDNDTSSQLIEEFYIESGVFKPNIFLSPSVKGGVTFGGYPKYEEFGLLECNYPAVFYNTLYIGKKENPSDGHESEWVRPYRIYIDDTGNVKAEAMTLFSFEENIGEVKNIMDT